MELVCSKDSRCCRPQVLGHEDVTALLMQQYAKKSLYMQLEFRTGDAHLQISVPVSSG